jgi:hypothetical protein
MDAATTPFATKGDTNQCTQIQYMYPNFLKRNGLC